MFEKYLPRFAGTRYFVGFQALNNRPELLAAIGKCINIWSYVDNELQGLFGVLLGVDSEAMHRVFVFFRRWAQQKEALTAAAKGKNLSSDEILIYTALIADYGRLESHRNRYLAHGCFGVCPDDTDLLFVITVDDHVLWQADILPKHLKGIVPTDPHEGLKEHIYVLTKTDLDTLYLQMEQLWWDLFYFNGYLRAPSEAGRVAEFQKLVNSPRIRSRVV
jgi:hypothetical protein